MWCFDEFHDEHQILVTGSTRLDMLRKRDDLLQSRYHHLRLHSLSVKELGIKKQHDFLTLLELGGFPEPYFFGSKIKARRWSTEYRSLLVTLESLGIGIISDLANLKLLSLRLPELVDSPLSVNALQEDLQVTHKTLSRWLTILENVYMIFRLPLPLGCH